jgi:hypothetical protein
MPFRPHSHRRPPKSLSGLKGVIFQKNARFELKKPWKAYLRKNGQYVCLGYFATKEDAARAYDAEAIRVYGPDTYLNRV